MSHPHKKLLPLTLARSQHSQSSSPNQGPSIPQPPPYRASVHDNYPLDFPERIEQKLAQYNASQNVFKRWLFEIISVGTSAICMGEIAPANFELYMC